MQYYYFCEKPSGQAEHILPTLSKIKGYYPNINEFSKKLYQTLLANPLKVLNNYEIDTIDIPKDWHNPLPPFFAFPNLQSILEILLQSPQIKKHLAEAEIKANALNWQKLDKKPVTYASLKEQISDFLDDMTKKYQLLQLTESFEYTEAEAIVRQEAEKAIEHDRNQIFLAHELIKLVAPSYK